MFIAQNVDDFTRNRSMHKYGFILFIDQGKVKVQTFDRNQAVTSHLVSLIGNRVFFNNQSYTWKEFMEALALASHKPQPITQLTPVADQTQCTKKFTTMSLDGLIDFYDLFSEDNINTIKKFDMESIGKFKINTAPSIMRADTPVHQRILASVLKGSVDAVERNDAERQLFYSRLLWLLPPILLRNPKSTIRKRLEAFVNGDLDVCINGLCSTHDNYFAIQKSPASIHKAASDKVFNGQYSKAMVTLLNETSTATNEQKKLAMIAKHPHR